MRATGIRPRSAPYGRLYPYQRRRRRREALIEFVGGLLVFAMFFALVWFWLAVGAPLPGPVQ